jgi:hypothetical protein
MKPIHFLLTTATLIAGCSRDTTDDGVDENGNPVKLVLEKLGPDYDSKTSTLRLGCDGSFTVTFGPSEDSENLLDLWILNPPKACSSTSQACGYLDVKLKQGTRTLVSYQTMLLTSTTTLRNVSGEVTLEAKLIQGNSGEPWLTREKSEVSTSKKFQIDLGCETGSGGAGGAAP